MKYKIFEGGTIKEILNRMLKEGYIPCNSETTHKYRKDNNLKKWFDTGTLFIKGKFRWQESYGAFSYSHSHIDRVVKYIINQEQHHKKKTFREEYIELLNRFNVDYDERYILKDIQ